MTTKRLTISISQVAPLIGFDKYNNFPKNLCEIWRKYEPEEFRRMELELKATGEKLANSSEMNDIWEIDDLYGTNILEQVKAINANKDKTSGEMVKLQSAMGSEIEKIKELSSSEKAEIIKKMCSLTNKSHGVNNEDNIIATFCKYAEKTIQQTQGWVEIPLETKSIPINWVVIGKYDGITTENELVEAKMRQKSLFKTVRDYENIQVQLYLHALKFQQAYLVEGINSKTNSKTNSKNNMNMNIYVNEIAYDDIYVNEIILSRLVKFTEFFETFIKDDKMKQTILKNDPQGEIYNIFANVYLGIETTEIDF